MRLIFGLITRMFLYFSSATMAALLGLLLILWLKGHLTADKTTDVIAAAYGIQPQLNPAAVTAEPPQVSYEDVLERRILTDMDRDLREHALDKATDDVRNRQAQLDDDRAKYNQLIEQFEQRLAELREGAVSSNLRAAAQTLEVLRPEQAKEQILKLLNDNREDEVITLLQLVPKDVGKKILSEFTTAEDRDKLYGILKTILSGSGEGDLIESVQEQIDAFKDNQT